MKRKLCFLFALTAAVCIFSCAVPAFAVDFEDLTTQKETKATGQTQADTTQKAEKVAAKTTGSTATAEETHENSTAPAAEKSETKPDSTGKTAAVAGGVIAGVIVIAGVVIAIKKRH